MWPGVSEETNSGVKLSWMVNEGKLSADPNVKTETELAALEAEAEAKEQNEEQQSGGNDEGGDTVAKEEELLDMLYRPLALRTNGQKRIQILLLEQLIRAMKLSFNQKFNSCFATKEEKLDEITTKNNRMVEILAELKVEEDYFVPKWKNSEFPDRVVTVTDDEIPVGKYVQF